MADYEHYQDETFENAELELDGKSFKDCVFRKCTLYYRGGPPPQYEGEIDFSNTSFRFADYAANTIKCVLEHLKAEKRAGVLGPFHVFMDEIQEGARSEN